MAQRGGILITALIFVAMIGISLVSYLALSRTTSTISHRSVYLTAAHDLAETGLEQGLWALNQANAGNTTAAWTDWTLSGGAAVRKFTGFDYANGVTGLVYVMVENYGSGSPAIIARGVLSAPNGFNTEKWLRITTTARSVFAYGLLARTQIIMSGGAWMDSWRSDPDNNASTPAVGWSPGNARTNAQLASMSTAIPSISIGSADIYGTASVGASSPYGLAMSWGGQVGPPGMPISGSRNVASGAIKTDFTATFESVTVPTGGTTTSPYHLPYSLSVAPWYVSMDTIGSAGTTTVLQMNQLIVDGAGILWIDGDVTLILPPDTITTLKVAGSGQIRLKPNATLTVYTPGNIDIAGAGIANSGAPKDFQIWSPRTTTGQTIRLSGSGALYGILYAPYADLTLPGSTDFGGAAIVNSANLSGSGAYHFDESLLNYSNGGSLRISNYQELSSPIDRATYLPSLSF